jgi:hypothetical protein
MLFLKVSASVSGYVVVQLVEALRDKLEVRGFDPSGRTVDLGSTQPLTEMSTWDI